MATPAFECPARFVFSGRHTEATAKLVADLEKLGEVAFTAVGNSPTRVDVTLEMGGVSEFELNVEVDQLVRGGVTAITVYLPQSGGGK